MPIIASSNKMPNRIIPYNPALKELARSLRKQSTKAEIILWKHIQRKALGVEFHRQVPVDNFIVDFYCHELCLAIEVDGGSHDDEEVGKKDILRQNRLEKLGVHFIRFSEMDIRIGVEKVIVALAAFIGHHKSQT